jgi:hypothetical protein
MFLSKGDSGSIVLKGEWMLLIVVIAVLGLQILVLTDTNYAYAQWILPSDLGQIYQNIHHSSLGVRSEGNSQSDNNNSTR